MILLGIKERSSSNAIWYMIEFILYYACIVVYVCCLYNVPICIKLFRFVETTDCMCYILFKLDVVLTIDNNWRMLNLAK